MKVDRSPKCHCEIAGDGIEYCWGAAKLYYRAAPLSKKQSKVAFHKLVQESTSSEIGGNLNISTVRSCAKRVREYMLAYTAIDEEINAIKEAGGREDDLKVNYALINRCVKLYKRKKCHRSTRDFDSIYIKSITKRMGQNIY